MTVAVTVEAGKAVERAVEKVVERAVEKVAEDLGVGTAEVKAEEMAEGTAGGTAEEGVVEMAAVTAVEMAEELEEEMQLLLDSVKRDIATKETRAREKEVRMGREVDSLRKGLMAGSGEMSATGFYVGGEPI